MFSYLKGYVLGGNRLFEALVMGSSCSSDSSKARSSSSISQARSQDPFSETPQARFPLSDDSPLLIKYNQASNLRACRTRLLFFAYQGLISEVQSCLEEGFPINQELTAEGWTLLHLAAQAGNVQLIELLLSAGAKLDIQEKEYLWTPLMVAVMNGQLEAVYVLVHKGASMGARDRDGQTARTLADKYSQTRISGILNELLRRK